MLDKTFEERCPNCHYSGKELVLNIGFTKTSLYCKKCRRFFRFEENDIFVDNPKPQRKPKWCN